MGEYVLEKKDQRMQPNESHDCSKGFQSDIQQIPVIDIDEIPSLTDQKHQTKQHDGYQNMSLTNKNETDNLEKTEEEQLKKEFLESSESKNFAVGETVLIDGLKTGP